RRIATEKLVATQAGNRHLESQFTRRLADEPGIEAINRGLVHCIEDFGQVVPKLLLRHDTRGVSRAILGRNLLCNYRLILISTAEFFESQCHSLDILLPCITHEADQGTGVNSTREECADRHVGYKMMPDAVEQRFANGEPQILIVCGRARNLRAAI